MHDPAMLKIINFDEHVHVKTQYSLDVKEYQSLYHTKKIQENSHWLHFKSTRCQYL